MITVDISYIRMLAGFPPGVSDGMIEPHAASALQRVRARLGDVDLLGPEDTVRAREAAACFAIAFALPVLNTFYLSHAKNVPRAVAETDYVFHEPGELLKLVNYWEKRGYEALRDVGRGGAGVGITVI